MRLSSKLRCAGAIVGAMLISGAACAADVIVPTGIIGEGDGNYNNNAPFATNIHQQQIFTAADFGTAPVSITAISFRIDYYSGKAFSSALSNISMVLSTAKTSVGTFSSTFANNVGADAKSVYSGALSLSASPVYNGDGTNTFNVVVTFQNAFTYNPLAGDLLLETVNSGTITGAGPILDASNQYPTETKRLFNATLGAATGNASNISLVADFTTAPAAVASVPEPASWAMMLAGFGLVGGAVRRRRMADGVDAAAA